MTCRKALQYFSLTLAVLFAVQWTAVAQIIEDPERTRGTLVSPVAGQQHDLVTLTGPGCFVSAFANQNGSVPQDTVLRLLIDGRTVVGTTWGDSDRLVPLGISRIGGTVKIGFPQALFFNESLVLRTTLPGSGTMPPRIIGEVIAGVCRESGARGPKK